MKHALHVTSWLALTVAVFTVPAFASTLPVLQHPNAHELVGPVFVQPFAGLMVVSASDGIGQTEPFFSSLPPGSLPENQVVNILGNFQAFDPLGNPTTFDIAGVMVTNAGKTFTPAFGQFNFAGESSVTFSDALNPLNTTTFSAADFTLAFPFMSDPSLSYSYTLKTTGLPVGSQLIFDDAETGRVPEPTTMLLFGCGLVVLFVARPAAFGVQRFHARECIRAPFDGGFHFKLKRTLPG